ncbi:MAG: hypothetical protein CPSOU_1993 [uncultured Paraburkholderia sp.]|nr:MAG: hypothetical protein CPSOU_1993 [uncultured Paraburkholderia sp.]
MKVPNKNHLRLLKVQTFMSSGTYTRMASTATVTVEIVGNGAGSFGVNLTCFGSAGGSFGELKNVRNR